MVHGSISTLIRATILLGFVGLLLVGCSPEIKILDVQRARHFANLGGQFLQKKDFAKAEAAFHVSLEYATTALALDGLGCAALQQGHVLDAESYLLQAVEEDPTYAGAYGNLALLYEMVGGVLEAHRYFSLALTLDPGNFRIRNNFAAFLYDNRIDKKFIKDLLLEAVVSSVSTEDTQIIENNLYRLENSHD